MKTKGRISIVAVTLAAMCVAVSVFNCGPSKPRLFIYNWAYYIPDEVISDFEKIYGVKVVYDIIGTNEEMYTKLKVGKVQYDIVFPSGDHVSMMIKDDMLAEIDNDQIPNLMHFDQSILDRMKHDPEFRYSVPYVMGAAGVTLNTSMVDEYEESWRIFENPTLWGRMTLLDDMREVLGAALKTLSYSINTTDETELQEAKQLVSKWREGITKFDAEAFGKGFAAGEFWAVHSYVENVYEELDGDSLALANTKFFIPKEGGPMYVDNMVIMKNARNYDLAHQFINYLHEPSVYAKIMDYFLLPSIVNIPARDLMEEEPLYNVEDLENCEFIEDLGEFIELYNKIWQEIRVGR